LKWDERETGKSEVEFEKEKRGLERNWKKKKENVLVEGDIDREEADRIVGTVDILMGEIKWALKPFRKNKNVKYSSTTIPTLTCYMITCNSSDM
jgi:hypothetical protein